MKQRIAILGSTGSIGRQALEVIRANKDLFEVKTITANNNWELLVTQAMEYHPDSVVIANEAYYTHVKKALERFPVKVYAGSDALCQVVSADNVDTVMSAPALNDFGDAIRTYANTGAEDATDLSTVSLSLPMFAAYADGYLSQQAKTLLSSLTTRILFQTTDLCL